MSEDQTRFVWEALKAFGLASAPFLIAWALYSAWQRRKRARTQRLMLEASQACARCESRNTLLHFVDLTSYEGVFLNLTRSHQLRAVLCRACVDAVAAEANARIRRTFWRSFQGPIGLLSTYSATRQLLREVMRREDAARGSADGE